MIKKLNRGGFTLIELLAVIAIIGLVIGLSTFGIINVVNNSKDQASIISKGSVQNSGLIYSKEANSEDWIDISDQDYQYFCVTIQELINKGLLSKNAKFKDDLSPANYVVVKKNKVTLVSTEAMLVPKDEKEVENCQDDDEHNCQDLKKSYQICTGNIKNENIIDPTISGNKLYTDEIDINFEDAKSGDENPIEITEKECQYSYHSGFAPGNTNTIKIDASATSCEITNIKTRKPIEPIYVRVCMKTKRNSKACSESQSFTPLELQKPIISVDDIINGNIKITYDDTGIKNKEDAGHYFKSDVSATSSKDVYNCKLNEDVFTCDNNSTTNNIEIGKWYKTSGDITLENTILGEGKVYARITDKTNNYAENSKDIPPFKPSIIKENITYSCPSGYTCTENSCSSSSKCKKIITGEISTMYYCPHNNSYQKSMICSYNGWENAAMDLGCSTTQTCSDTAYSCPSGSTLSGTNCYMYNRYSCRSGWTSVATGYCEYQCATGNVLLYSHCSGYGVCKNNSAYSCISTCGSGDTQDCRANISLYGSHPNHSCRTTNTIYNCYTPATTTENCVTTGQYYAGSYRGCRLVGSDEVTNGFSCSSGNTGNYNDVGTSSCSVSGYNLTKVLDGNCPDNLKFDKDGVKYCDTANDYWKGKSCTTGSQFGASAIYKLTCTKLGTKKYYCDVTGDYTTSKPSSCSKTEYLSVESNTATIYVCPNGYSTADSPVTKDSICIKNS